MIDAEVVRAVIQQAKDKIDAGEPPIVDVTGDEYRAVVAIADNTYNFLVQEVWGRTVERGELPTMTLRLTFRAPMELADIPIQFSVYSGNVLS